MNYIYDILVNFKYPLIDFYDWNSDDDIENIKRIPFYKIKSDVLNEFKYNKFKIDITSIKGLTKLFNSKKTYNSLVYTDSNEAIVFKFNEDGICIGKSMLMIDEEMEILESSYLVKSTDIEYTILSRDNVTLYKTRKQVSITDYLIKTIDKINDVDKLKYINYICLGEYNASKNDLINHISSVWCDKYYEIYDFLSNYSLNKN